MVSDNTITGIEETADVKISTTFTVVIVIGRALGLAKMKHTITILINFLNPSFRSTEGLSEYCCSCHFLFSYSNVAQFLPVMIVSTHKNLYRYVCMNN